jgi:hypothetical protein
MSMMRVCALVLLFAAHIACAAVTDSVFLVGDAGLRGENDAVLRALRTDVTASSASLGPGHVTVIFLGDNVYDNGVPDEQDTRSFRAALKRLRGEVQNAAVNDGVRVFFVPGNHDWDKAGRRGLANIRRQAAELTTMNVEMLPRQGCPGPEIQNAGERLQVLFLDTQWWLHKFDKPTTTCTPGTKEGVATAIASALANAGGRMTIVVAHHPLTSAGPHGRDLESDATEQDQQNAANRAMRDAITRSFTAAPPLAWVSGHEHTLEVLKGTSARYFLVSGAGNAKHADVAIPDLARGDWLFAFPLRNQPRSNGGYMRLDVPDAGAPSVFVITVDPRGAKQTRFVQRLD